jgi:heme/copper-type cytochrome/quinol oxidase subunit 4
MWCTKPIIVLLAAILLCSVGQAWQVFSRETASIDQAIDDDIIAAGSSVSINAPVDSAIVAGGTVSINAPVKGDVIVAAGQVYVNSDIGGKVVAAGGNVNLGGNISSNLLAAGGQVNIHPGKTIKRDALITAGQVVNAGRVNGTLTVSANQFNNTGSAFAVKFHRVEDQAKTNKDDETLGLIFSLLSVLGYFILGVILVKYLPGIFLTVDGEMRSSTLLKTLLGFVVIIATFIAILLVAVTVVGLPIALISALLFAAALMLSGTFVSFSLGRWIDEKANIKRGDLACFAIGFVILNVLTHLPLAGGLISLISMSLGFAAMIYAARRLARVGQAKAA